MTPLLILLASVAGGLGAGARYLVDVGVSAAYRRRARSDSAVGRFPWGIVVVNVTGSFALGLVTATLPDAGFIVGAGFLGGYTTFSTAMLDTIGLWKDGARSASVLHLLGTFGLSVLAAGAGLALGSLR
ncbi:fluoride efflux transporter FluC [Microbacterium sp. NPDC056234]|uniref:fluoride efflux transporter FluC n=1 Tax=Microbacterium sp. NPDC056234 TaxID=3345757 RepID=UPI0035DACE5C